MPLYSFFCVLIQDSELQYPRRSYGTAYQGLQQKQCALEFFAN